MTIFRKIHYNAPVVLTFTFLSLVALVLGFATGGVSNALLFSVYRSPLSDPFSYFRFFGHVLGHVSVEHFFNNFVIILLIGPILEEKYGSKRLFLMILITALLTGALNVIFFKTAILGASGIVFMFIILGSFVNLQEGRIPLTFILVVVIFIGKEVVDGIYAVDNISHATHVVGGVCGAGLGFCLNRFGKKKASEML